MRRVDADFAYARAYELSAPRRLYRSRYGSFLGVCKGIAEYLGISSAWLRFFVILLTLFTGLWPVFILYMIASFAMPLEPVLPFQSEGERLFYAQYMRSRANSLRILNGQIAAAEARVRGLEARLEACKKSA